MKDVCAVKSSGGSSSASSRYTLISAIITLRMRPKPPSSSAVGDHK